MKLKFCEEAIIGSSHVYFEVVMYLASVHVRNTVNLVIKKGNYVDISKCNS